MCAESLQLFPIIERGAPCGFCPETNPNKATGWKGFVILEAVKQVHVPGLQRSLWGKRTLAPLLDPFPRYVIMCPCKILDILS